MNDLVARLHALGYLLRRNQKDAFGRVWPYRTSPFGESGGGTTNYFQTRAQVILYAAQVEQVHSWQT